MADPDVSQRIQFGRHKGTPWRELPVAYLMWMIEVMNNPTWVPWAVKALEGRISPSQWNQLSESTAPRAKSRKPKTRAKHKKGPAAREWVAPPAKFPDTPSFSTQAAVDDSTTAPWE